MKLAATKRPLATAVARHLLQDCQTYHIEFQGYLTNHVKHAVIALDRLEANSERIQEYYDQYCTMTPYDLPLEMLGDAVMGSENALDVSACSPAEFQTWRGKKQHWPEQLKYMQQQLQELSFNSVKLVQAHVPALLPGMAGSLTHGIIHLGWAIDADSPEMIAEGMAYLNYCYLGTETPLQVDKQPHATSIQENHPMESIIRVARAFQELNLGQEWIAQAKNKYDETFHPELVCAGFQWQLSKVMASVHPVATTLPTWLLDGDDDHKTLSRLFEALYFTVTWLYLATRDRQHGNFLMLHLITALWGVEHVCNVLLEDCAAGIPTTTTREALAHYYVMLICLIGTARNGFLDVQTLEQVQQDFPKEQVDDVHYDWTETVNRASAEVEEHNIKLVYVMKELWNRYGYWSGFSEAAKSFTLTPEIGPNKSTSFNAEDS